MHKKDQPPHDESSTPQSSDISSTPQLIDISATNEYNRPLRLVSEVEHTYVYAFCITFRSGVNFTAFVQFVGRSFLDLKVRHTSLATKGALVAVEFLAQGREPLLHTLREELIRRHGSE